MFIVSDCQLDHLAQVLTPPGVRSPRFVRGNRPNFHRWLESPELDGGPERERLQQDKQMRMEDPVETPRAALTRPGRRAAVGSRSKSRFTARHINIDAEE